MIDAAVEALQALMTVDRIFYLFSGVLMGLSLGAIPGLGGVIGLAILLPFTFLWEPHIAVSMMVGLLAVTNTSDSIPAILFGVPGTGSAQATIMDGYPLAQQGQAGRAFGASFTASAMGGLVSAVVVFLAVPVLRPAILSFGSPEFFMLALLGISMVAVLSGSYPIRGMIAAILGLLIGAIGQDPQTGVPRWVFSSVYLMGGIPLVPIALGLFAVPEITDILIKGTRISQVAQATRGVVDGMKDAVKNWWLVLRCAAFGVWFGAVPGIGGSVADWFAWGHARQTVKGASETFGKGDIRGVIAVDSTTNAKDGGAMIPTIAFGIPGNTPMALFLAGLVAMGLRPGPDMLTTDLDITYTLIWSLAIANLFGTGLALLLAKPIAKLSMVRIQYLAPVLFAIVVLASFQSTRHWGDIWVLLAASLLGWTMKRFAWPRPPLLLGLVLAPIIETYLWNSTRIYGAFGWMTRPIVIGVAVMIVLSVTYGLINEKRSREKRRRERAEAKESVGR